MQNISQDRVATFNMWLYFNDDVITNVLASLMVKISENQSPFGEITNKSVEYFSIVAQFSTHCS